MANVVYTTTLTRPMPEVALKNALDELLTVVPAKEILAQAFSENAPSKDDEGRALAFRLTDAGLGIFLTGTVGPPPNWKEWPQGVPEPDFSTYPLDRSVLDGKSARKP